MKTLIALFGLLSISSAAFAADHVPSMQDRYCGPLTIKTFIRTCPTCTPRSPQYTIRVVTRTLDELNSGHGFVQDHPENFDVTLALHTMPVPSPTLDTQVNRLQKSVQSLLTQGQSYCVVGALQADGNIDFNQVYEGEQ